MMEQLVALARWVGQNDHWVRPTVFLGGGALAATVVFVIARVPGARRPQFRDAPAWSTPKAMLAALAVFALFAFAGLAR